MEVTHTGPDPLVGSVFAGHRVDGVIGSGGGGTVYRATDLALDRAAALKVIKPALAGDAAFRERFVTESRLAAAIDHPNVIDVFHAGEHDGRLFVTMRLVEGRDLRQVMAGGGPLEPARAIAIAGQAAGALDAAHASGLVHRDVKPANILLAGDGRVFLTDFGLSERLAGEPPLSGADGAAPVVGTVDYIAPEQIRRRAEPRSDLYALACVVFEMLTGSVPFPVAGEDLKLWAHLSTPPPPLPLRPDLPDRLQPVLRRALDKEPGQRQETAAQFVRELESALSADAVAAPRRRRLGVGRPRRAEPLDALERDVGAASGRLRAALAPASAEVAAALDAHLAAVRDAADAARGDAVQLAVHPPAETRDRLRRELMRGRAASRPLARSLKQRILASDAAARRLAAVADELRRQPAELDAVADLGIARAPGDAAADRRIAGRLAGLQRDLRALL